MRLPSEVILQAGLPRTAVFPRWAYVTSTYSIQAVPRGQYRDHFTTYRDSGKMLVDTREGGRWLQFNLG